MKKVFEYTNYRNYLKDQYDELKVTSSSFSYRYFSKQCGFKSPNFLKLVIDGQRNLSHDSIDTFAKFFKLGKRESDYFKKLVLFNQAKTTTEKESLAKEILNSSIFKKLHPVTKDHFEYLSYWYYVAIRELISTKKIKLDAINIQKLLTPNVSLKDVEKALECLLRLKMIKRKDNRYIQSYELVSTGDEVSSAAVASFHREMFQLASSSIDRIESEKRDISAVTIALSEDSVKELKLMIQKFRKDVLALSESEKNKQVVYHMALQMFPLSKSEEDIYE